MAGVVVLCFPLIAAVGFGLVTAFDIAVLKDRRLLERYGQFFYIAFLLLPLVVVWVATAPDGGVPAMFDVEGGHGPWWVPVWLIAGILLGGALYAAEVWGTLALRNTPGLGELMRHPAVEGHTDVVKEQVRQVAAPAAFVLTAGSTVVIEDIVWRGFLIEFLDEDWELTIAMAVVVAGVSFGFNHIYFGLRGFAFKSLHGVVWGVLFVVSDVLVAVIVSHFTFNVWVWLKLRKGVNREPAPTAAPGRALHDPVRRS